MLYEGSNNFIRGHLPYFSAKTSLFYERILVTNAVNYYQL